MEKMLVVVFDSESKAYEGTKALRRLDSDGNITLHAEAVIKRNPDGTTTSLELDDEFPVRTVGGTAIGSLIGLVGGPYGVIFGATSGAVLGLVGDLYISGVSAEFVDEVSAKLPPGKYAVIADISEEWLTPVDIAMEKLGGMVLRASRRDVETDQIKADVDAIDRELAQLETEMKEASNERKSKLQAKIDDLKEKRQKKKDQAQKRSGQIRKEYDAKVQAMKEKAAQAHGKPKAALEARVAELEKEYQQTVSKWRIARAERLEKKADRLTEKAKKLRMEA
jgi:uncharacterized membrane protein